MLLPTCGSVSRVINLMPQACVMSLSVIIMLMIGITQHIRHANRMLIYVSCCLLWRCYSFVCNVECFKTSLIAYASAHTSLKHGM
jgi:hypothetical protein